MATFQVPLEIGRSNDRSDGSTYFPFPVNWRSSATSSRACRASGTLWARFPFTFDAGIVHTASGVPQDARRPETIEHLAFGFNITEPKRVARRRRYDSKTRIGIFPLVDWGWTRENCRTYLEKVLGVRWKKSCCVSCPFARVTEDLLARQRAHPAQMAEALLIEHLSLAMNPRGSLYRTCTLHTLTTRNEHTAALTAFAARLRETPWALYRVRRLYKAKGDAQRAVERLAVLPTEEQALDELHALARTEHMSLERIGRIPYVRFEHRQPEQYPTREGYYVIAPALIEPKPRFGLDRFDQAWTHTSQLCLIP
jgi:hypothetical protein